MNLIGSLLVAPPIVRGNFWHKTVIFITEHHHQGSVGFVLNKRSDVTLRDFGEQLGFNIDTPGFVYVGGPVNVKSLTLLHTNDWSSKNTMRVSEMFSISSADDILPRLAMGDCPMYWRMFLGMCGWGSGQLIGEIKGNPPWQQKNSWCTTSADIDLVFGNDQNDQWNSALDRSGLEFAQNLLS